MLIDVLTWAGVIGLAVVVVAAYLSGRTGVALGALFAGASFSGVTAPLGAVDVRVEMPALALLAVLIAWRQPATVVQFIKGNFALLAAVTLYIGPQILSSALLAEEPAESMKILAWLGLSMVGMVVALVLVASSGNDLRLPRWVVGAAAIQVAVGLGAVGSQAFFGTTWMVQAGDVLFGKTAGLSWEANILAINLAMALALVIFPTASEHWRGIQGRGLQVVGLLWVSLGLGLAYSRGGLVALAVGAVVVGLGVTWFHRKRLNVAMARVVPVATLSALALLTALGSIQVQALLGEAGVGWTPGTVIIEDVAPPDGPVVRPPSEPAATPKPREASPPEIRYVGTGDTLAVRLLNIRIALGELPRSPLIGLGTDSYRHRHDDAHISNLTVATLYEGGIVALAGLIGILGMALWAAWRLRLWGYLGALVILIVGYQVTDAFRFASNWILIGTVIGLWTSWRLRRGEQSRGPRANNGEGSDTYQ